jgi:hypothetical protein
MQLVVHAAVPARACRGANVDSLDHRALVGVASARYHELQVPLKRKFAG